jgi:DNA mismatch repair protein MutS
MVETAQILHHATANSLIIMDEIGRGTSTYDGISIAWAVAEYLVNNGKHTPKTLFATHYHELQALEYEYPDNIKNYHMAVIEENGQPVFLHTLQSGGASSSFGVAVANLAGIPEKVIERANEMLEELEKRSLDHQHTRHPEPVSGSQTQNKEMLKRIHRSSQEGSLDGPEVGIQHDNDYPHQSNLIEHIIIKDLIDVDIHQMTPLEALNKLAELKDKLKLMQTSSQEFLEAD